jgi:hypothetical protein
MYKGRRRRAGGGLTCRPLAIIVFNIGMGSEILVLDQFGRRPSHDLRLLGSPTSSLRISTRSLRAHTYFSISTSVDTL